LTQISAALTDAQSQLRSAVSTLRTLDRGGTDIPSGVREYSAQVGLLNQTIESTRARVATADRPDEFFSAWRADLDSIEDTELREAGEKRYAVARKELERLKGEMNRLRDTFRPFHAQLNDVEAYLRNDPTKTGVDQVRPKIRDIVRAEDGVLDRAEVVQKGIQDLLR
jgi:uncharacterized small protein (DUF1192 family)